MEPGNSHALNPLIEQTAKRGVLRRLGRVALLAAAWLIAPAFAAWLKLDADGGVTLYVQRDSPGQDKESNLLPAPDGSFMAVLRLYWPKDDALNGTWKQPQMQKLP